MEHPRLATIRAFILDMNGTMIDDMGFHNEAWAEMLAARGVPISKDEFMRQTAGMTNPEILRLMVNPEISDDEIGVFAKAKEEMYRSRFRPHLKPVAGLVELLQAAREAGIKIGVATAAPTDNIEFVLKGLALEPYLDAVVGASDITRGKPDPEIFLKSAERLGVSPDECMVFEDAFAGIEAARRAGMPVIAITTSLTPDELADLPHVVQIVPDFTSLNVMEILGSNP